VKLYLAGNNHDRLCPRIGTPRHDCYCLDMNSGKIQFALHYCMGDFERCRIYQSLLTEQRSADAGGTVPPPGEKA
jgi:hypothetical protein